VRLGRLARHIGSDTSLDDSDNRAAPSRWWRNSNGRLTAGSRWPYRRAWTGRTAWPYTDH